MRLGKSRQRPSTSYFVLASLAASRRRAPNASRDSSQGFCGKDVFRLFLTHETAVSWRRTSCNAPGCSAASPSM